LEFAERRAISRAATLRLSKQLRGARACACAAILLLCARLRLR